MKVIDTRHNSSTGECYRKYRCGFCEKTKYSVESTINCGTLFRIEWGKCDRKRLQKMALNEARNQEAGVK